MAFPKNISKISTNLSRSKLSDVIRAIENKRVRWTDGSLYSGSRLETFFYKGEKFELSEWFEEVTSIHRVTRELSEAAVELWRI